MVDLRERFGVRDGVIPFIIESSCASLRPSLRGSVDSPRTSLNKSVSEAFRAGYICSRFYAGTDSDGTTLRFSCGVASNDGDGSTWGRDVVDTPVNCEVIQL